MGVVNFKHQDQFKERIEHSFEILFHELPKFEGRNKFFIYYIDNLQKMSVIKSECFLLLGYIYHIETHCSGSEDDFIQDVSLSDLNSKHYGGFIAVLERENSIVIFRDITGKVQMFYALLYSGEVIFSNSLILLSYVINHKLAVNTEYFCSYLLYEKLDYGRTFIKNILELPNGCSLTIKNNKLCVVSHWKPNQITPFSPGVSDIASLMELVISKYIKLFDRIVLNFSGGLDSTSILYCLLSVVKNSKKIELINYYAKGFRCFNELKFARAISNELNISLIERIIDVSILFQPIFIQEKNYSLICQVLCLYRGIFKEVYIILLVKILTIWK